VRQDCNELFIPIGEAPGQQRVSMCHYEPSAYPVRPTAINEAAKSSAEAKLGLDLWQEKINVEQRCPSYQAGYLGSSLTVS
jgi:hypothetical protein